MTRLEIIIRHKRNELNGWKRVNKIFENYFENAKIKEDKNDYY